MGVFFKVFISPFTCSDWEARFWGVFFKKVYFPSLVPTGKPALVGCFMKKLSLYLFPLGKAFWSGSFEILLCKIKKDPRTGWVHDSKKE